MLFTTDVFAAFAFLVQCLNSIYFGDASQPAENLNWKNDVLKKHSWPSNPSMALLLKI